MISEKVVIQIEFAIDDRPSGRIYVGDAVDGHRVRAIAAVLRKVLLRVGSETREILRRCKAISDALPLISVLVETCNRMTQREVGNRVITLHADAVNGIHRGNGGLV